MRTPASFLFEARERVGTITLNRPERLNALTFEVYRELCDFFWELESDNSVAAVIVTGTGRGFCSGGDVESIIGPLLSRTAAGLLEFTRMTCELIRSMRALHKPIIAAINGTAAGAGAVIALASDLRVASEAAKIHFLFVKVGLSGADMGAGYLLPKLIGFGRASELLLFGDGIDAATAERYGLFNKVVPGASLLPEAFAWAKRLAEGPGFALGMTKELLNAELGLGLDDALESEARGQALCMQTEDFREAHAAFVEKRSPHFKGR